MRENFHGIGKFQLCTQFISGKESEGNQETVEQFRFQLSLVNILWDAGWKPKRLANKHKALSMFQAGVY
jgi:hypothetical protein